MSTGCTQQHARDPLLRRSQTQAVHVNRRHPPSSPCCTHPYAARSAAGQNGVHLASTLRSLVCSSSAWPISPTQNQDQVSLCLLLCIAVLISFRHQPGNPMETAMTSSSTSTTTCLALPRPPSCALPIAIASRTDHARARATTSLIALGPCARDSVVVLKHSDRCGLQSSPPSDPMRQLQS